MPAFDSDLPLPGSRFWEGRVLVHGMTMGCYWETQWLPFVAALAYAADFVAVKHQMRASSTLFGVAQVICVHLGARQTLENDWGPLAKWRPSQFLMLCASGRIGFVAEAPCMLLLRP